MSDWDDFPIGASLPDPAEAFQVPDNGFQLTLLWAAGPERGFRVPIDHPGFVTVTVHRDGMRRSHREPRTEEDLTTVDEMVNGYLAEARIPQLPRGYDWFCLVPPALRETTDPAGELFREMDAELRERTDAGEVLGVVRLDLVC